MGLPYVPPQKDPPAPPLAVSRQSELADPWVVSGMWMVNGIHEKTGESLVRVPEFWNLGLRRT